MGVSHIVDLLTIDDLLQVIQKQNYNNQILLRTFTKQQMMESGNIEEQVKALRLAVSQLADDVVAISADVADLDILYDGLASRVGSLETWKSTVNTQITNLTNRVANLETKMTAAETKLADHERRIKALEEA